MRKILSKIIKIMFIIIIINSILLLIQYFSNIKVRSSVSNMNEYTQDDKILIQTGGAKTFPMTLGNRVYLYDIEHNKWKLIKSSLIPFYGFGSKFILNNRKIYYNRFGAEEGIELYSKKTRGIGFEKREIDQCGICTVSTKNMYYLKRDEEDTFRNHIYKKNMKTGKTEIFLKGQFSYVLRQDHGRLYTFNNEDKKIYEIRLKDKKISKYSGNMEPMWIGYGSDENIIVVDGRNIYMIDKKKNKKIYYVKDLKNEKEFLNESVIKKNKKLYCSNENMDILELDLQTGKNKKIFSANHAEKINKIDFHKIVFTKSYVVVGIIYQNYKKEKINIYDYNGKMKKSIKILQAF